MIRLLVVAPSRVYSEAVAEVVAAKSGSTVVGSAASAEEATAKLRELRPDAVLVDLPLSEARRMSVMLAQMGSAARVIAFSVPEDEQQIVAWAQLGASGCITRDATLEELVAAVADVARGEIRCSPQAARLLFRYARTGPPTGRGPQAKTPLTRREDEILQFMIDGMTNKDIARTLSISVPTVKNHVHHIFQKLQIRRRADVASWVQPAASSKRDLYRGHKHEL